MRFWRVLNNLKMSSFVPHSDIDSTNNFHRQVKNEACMACAAKEGKFNHTKLHIQTHCMPTRTGGSPIKTLFKFMDVGRSSGRCNKLYTVGEPGNKCLVGETDNIDNMALINYNFKTCSNIVTFLLRIVFNFYFVAALYDFGLHITRYI